MKSLFLILGLLTLVSCNDAGTKKWVEDCASDQSAGHTCETPPPAPPVELPVIDNSLDLTYDRLATGVKSITYKGIKLTLLNHGDGWRTFAYTNTISEGHQYLRNLRRMIVFCKNGMLLEYVQLKYLSEHEGLFEHRHGEMDYMHNLESKLGGWGDTIETADADLPTFLIEGKKIITSELNTMTFEFTEDFLNGIE